MKLSWSVETSTHRTFVSPQWWWNLQQYAYSRRIRGAMNNYTLFSELAVIWPETNIKKLLLQNSSVLEYAIFSFIFYMDWILYMVLKGVHLFSIERLLSFFSEVPLIHSGNAYVYKCLCCLYCQRRTFQWFYLSRAQGICESADQEVKFISS